MAIGGAPVYGSDAIAGTVNVILKKRYTGAEVRLTSGITEEGDNFRYNIAGAGGIDLLDGRANITAAVSYEKVDGLLANARGFFRDNLGNLNNPTSAQALAFTGAGRTPANDGRINTDIGFNNSTTDGFPGSILARNVTIPHLSRGGVLISGAQAFNLRFDTNGDLMPHNRGTIFNAALPSAAARGSGGDGFTFNDFAQITSNLERLSANLFASVDLDDDTRFFLEGMYFRGRGDELVQQPSFNSSLFGGGSGALTFNINNPFLTTQARNTLVAAGYTGNFTLGRVNLDLADLTGYSENNLYRGVMGIEGDFQLGGRDFNFEVSTTYGINDFIDYRQDINQQNFVNAVNVASVGGQIVCTTTPTTNATPGFTPIADPNCVPLNLFGEGRSSQAARDYIIEDTSAKSVLDQWVVNFNIGGSPFDVFGNPIAFNVGYEHRMESASFTPDAFAQAGRGRTVAIAPNKGKYNLNEFFGELMVPLITPSNDIFINKLEGYGRVRHVDNTVNGSFLSWSAGGAMAVIPDIEVRGNYTKSFRAPAITESFSPVTNTFVTVPDLCSVANRNAGPVPTIRSANCAAFLTAFPTATPLAASLATVPGRSGGNPDLGNEEAKSYTLGAIVRPRFIPGLSIAVDYLNIHITNPIASLTVAQIAGGCFDNEQFDTSDPANGNAFCSLIRRDSTGQVPADPLNPAVTSGFVNGNEIKFSGYQAVLDYSTSLSGIGIPGTLDIGADAFWLKNRIVDITGIAPSRSDGVLGDPEWQGQLRLRYFNDSFGVSTNFNYVGEQLSSRTNRGDNPNDTREFDHFDDYITIDAGIFFETENNFRLNLSVTNLTNRVGQSYYGFIIPASINDSLGRRYAITVAKKF